MVEHRPASQRTCGNCKHSYHACSAVLVRLGCWKGYVRFDSFTLPHRLECGGKKWEKRQ